MDNDDNTHSMVTLTKGTMVSHYRIIEKIGAGGMGEVYLAEDTELSRKVALKFMPDHLAKNEDARARFKREAQAAARLDHPNIVPVYEVGEHKGRPFFAMAHIEGQSLREVIKDGKLSITDTVELAAQICDGLHEAHTAGVVHRDIKPANVIVDTKGRPRLLDFGLAAVKGTEKLTKTGSTLGTLGYMSPEQVQGAMADERSDLFSLGVVFYEMITGRLPFEAEHEAAIHYNIVHEEPEPLARYKSGGGGELQQIIDKALAKDPSLRYQHADGMMADLRRITTPSRRHKKSRFAVLVAAAATVAVAAIAGYYGYSYLSEDKTELDGPKRLVVLPFDNLGDEDQAYFASGITDEVISRLSSISGLSVVSRMSAAKMKQAGEDIKDIGKELGVEYVLDASTRYQIGSDGTRHVRLTTQLINVTEDRVIWSQTYDTVMTEVFSVQSRIAEQVAEQMDVVLLDAEKAEVWERWTESEDAWDYYIRGNAEAYRYGGYGERALRTGLSLLNKAIKLDSNFAPPYANLASIYGRLHHFGFERTDSIKALSKRLAERAGELTEHVWVSNWPLARYYYFCEKNHDSALYYYEKAYRSDTSHADYLAGAHHCLRRMGRWQEAYDNMVRLVELEPKSEWYKLDLASNCFYMHRYEEAETLLKEVIALSPSFWEANSTLFRLYLEWQGDFEKARAVVRQSEGFIDSTKWTILLDWITNLEEGYAHATDDITMPPLDSFDYHYGLGQAYFGMGKIDSSQFHFGQMRNQYDRDTERLKTNPNINKSYALMFAGLGERELAIRHMDKALELIPTDKNALAHSDMFAGYLEVAVLLGDTKMQVVYMDSALSMPSMQTGLGWFLVDPDYREAVLHPDFKALMAKHADAIQWRLYEKRFGSQ